MDNNQQSFHKARYPELDCLRGVAVLSVVIYHYTVDYDRLYKIYNPNDFYFSFGFLSVELFFIISGFVIFLTLENSKNKFDFLVSRFSRLYPAYWAAIFLTVLVVKIIPLPLLGNYSLKQIAINLTMLQGFFKGLRPIDQVYWTLKFEITFYFIMYIFYITKILNKIRFICVIWLLLSFLSFNNLLPEKKYLDVLLILKFAPLFIGGVNFYLLKKDNKQIFSHILILLSLIVAVPWIGKYETETFNPQYAMLTIVFFYLLFYAFVFKGLSFLNNKILMFFGTISYSLYLIHNVIGCAIIYRLKSISDSRLFFIPVTFVIVVLLSSMVSFWIEKPTMRFIRKKYHQSKLSNRDRELV